MRGDVGLGAFGQSRSHESNRKVLPPGRRLEGRDPHLRDALTK